jgi:hypothetical protein
MFAGTLVFILGGRLIADKISNNQNALYLIVGVIFTITALIQIWKMVRKKDAGHLTKHPKKIMSGHQNTISDAGK